MTSGPVTLQDMKLKGLRKNRVREPPWSHGPLPPSVCRLPTVTFQLM